MQQQKGMKIADKSKNDNMAHRGAVTRIKKRGKTYNVPTALLKAHLERGAVVVGPEAPEPKEAKKVGAPKKEKAAKVETPEHEPEQVETETAE